MTKIPSVDEVAVAEMWDVGRFTALHVRCVAG